METTAASSADLCAQISALYADNWLIKFTYLVQLLLGAISLVCVIGLAVLWCMWSQSPIHSRMLVVSLLIGFALANTGVLLSSVYHLQALVFRGPDSICYWFSFTFYDCHGKPCDESTQLFTVIRLLYNVALIQIYTSPATLALERLTSLVFSLSYRARKNLSVLIIILHWPASIYGSFHASGIYDPSVPKSRVHQAHCSAHIPTPAQFRPFFPIFISSQAFTLAVFSALLFHQHYSVVKRLPKGFSKTLFDNIVATASSFPIVCVLVGLYVSHMLLGSDFQGALIGMPTTNVFSLKESAQYTEFQTALLPAAGLVLFMLTIRSVWPAKREPDDQTVPRLSRLEQGFDARSDALSFHSIQGALRCNRDVREECETVCAKLAHKPADAACFETNSAQTASSGSMLTEHSTATTTDAAKSDP